MENKMTDIQKAASALGRKGGSAKSEKKRLSSQRNGFKKGIKNVWQAWWVKGRTVSPGRIAEGTPIKARNKKEALEKYERQFAKEVKK